MKQSKRKTGLKLTLPVSPKRFADTLLEWFRINKRDLPWRSNPEPYRVWLSEIMLQQTQVKTALPYFERFIKRYPTIEDLANSETDEVLDLWAGLGYYNRARNLQKAARQVSEDLGGEFPDSYSQAIKLPGIGRYSAGAILSIAFGRVHPVLDGNVRRVLARYMKIDSPISSQVTGQLWNFLEKLVSEPCISVKIGDFNQALMELGALVCTPREPKCTQCPLSDSCGALQSDLQRVLPVSEKQVKRVQQEFTSLVLRRNGEFLMMRNETGPYLKGFWEFPRLQGRIDGTRLEEEALAHLGLRISPLREIERFVHQITFRKLLFFPIICDLLDLDYPDHFKWIRPHTAGYPVSAYMKRILDFLSRGERH